MLEAIAVWRQFPTQIEAGLTIHAHRSIGEWHRGEMSSRQLLGLIAELPESSTYRAAADRTMRLCTDPDDGVHLFGAAGQLPQWATPISTFTDWTLDRKIQARIAREIASSRADHTGDAPDLTGLREPLQQILMNREADQRTKARTGAQSVIRAGLFGTPQQ